MAARERYPSDQDDPEHVFRRKLPGQKTAEVYCDTCAYYNRPAWKDFHFVLYRQQPHPYFTLECTTCWSIEKGCSLEAATRIFRSRTNANNQDRRKEFEEVAAELRLCPVKVGRQ
jgi:hypothetical protein